MEGQDSSGKTLALIAMRQTRSPASVQLRLWFFERVLSSRMQWSRTQWLRISEPPQCPLANAAKFRAHPSSGGWSVVKKAI